MAGGRAACQRLHADDRCVDNAARDRTPVIAGEGLIVDHHHGEPPEDLVGSRFWEDLWSGAGVRRFKRLNYYHREEDRFLRRFLPRGGRFLELGAANSLWIARFADDHEVWGVDYSETGLERVRHAVPAAGDRLVLGDVFDAGNGVPRDYFDLVFSDGLIEHFTDAAGAARAWATYLRPGGVVVTNVPNMSGLIGRLHRLIAPSFYVQHVRHTPRSLDEAHTDAGLSVVSRAHHWGHVSLGVVNYERQLRPLPKPLATLIFSALLATQQVVAWTMALLRLPQAGTVAPFLRGAYRRAE